MRAAAVCEPCNNSVSDWLVCIIGNLGTSIADALGLFQLVRCEMGWQKTLQYLV